MQSHGFSRFLTFQSEKNPANAYGIGICGIFEKTNFLMFEALVGAKWELMKGLSGSDDNHPNNQLDNQLDNI
ncbi:hypothetical protein [Romeriopsis navalis]|uniref:hypothetical protein n=1 Tax=Romeriopsis navalis TaxID=2992132 RepID=UPI0021F8DB72|nr:hypothetical protein [Romeriopsis navalis]